MLVTLGRMFGILFPFVKEIFLGKPSNQRKKKIPEKHTFFKQALIFLGVLSFLCCIFLLSTLKNFYAENKKLKGQLSTSKPISPKIPPVITAASKPVDTPTPTQPYLPVSEPVTPPARPRARHTSKDDTPKHNKRIFQDTPIDDESSKRKLIESLMHSDTVTGQ
jgi:hypothetical protein